jgi:hypothetical protein
MTDEAVRQFILEAFESNYELMRLESGRGLSAGTCLPSVKLG